MKTGDGSNWQPAPAMYGVDSASEPTQYTFTDIMT